MQATHVRDGAGSGQEYLPQQRILYRLLPILGVAVLIGLIEGWPPAPWLSLLRVYTQWNTLWSQQQTALLLPVSVLALQSILLLAAWVLCLWLAGREISYLAGFNRHRTVARSQGNFAPATPQPIGPPPVQAQPVARPAFPGPPPQAYQAAQPPVQPQPMVPPSYQAVPPGPPPVQPQPMTPPGPPPQVYQAAPPPVQPQPMVPPSYQVVPQPAQQVPYHQDNQAKADEFPSNPFEEVAEKVDLMQPFQAISVSPQAIDNPFATPEEEASIQLEANDELEIPVVDEELKLEESLPTEETPEEETVDELEETGKRPRVTGDALTKIAHQAGNPQQQSEVLRDLGFYQTIPDTQQEKGLSVLGDVALELTMNQQMEMEAISPTRAPHNAPSNPFDVQSDLIDLFQEASTIEETPDSEQEETEVQEESIYVFGNPFEGPLPDVFHHDEALKKVLQENKNPNEKKSK